MLAKLVMNICLFLLCALCWAETETRTPFPTGEIKVVAYSKSFAKRFVLPEPPPELELTGVLQAIEFSVGLGPKNIPIYICHFKVYLDSNLAVAYPEEGSGGTQSNVSHREHFFLWPDPNAKHWLTLSLEDRKYLGDRQGRYMRRAALASPDVDWPKRGFFGELWYEKFYRDLFQGISYAKLNTDCGSVVKGGKKEQIQLWLEHTEGRDYRYVVKPDPKDFLKFSLPAAFYQQAVKWANEAQQHNEILKNRN